MIYETIIHAEVWKFSANAKNKNEMECRCIKNAPHTLYEMKYIYIEQFLFLVIVVVDIFFVIIFFHPFILVCVCVNACRKKVPWNEREKHCLSEKLMMQ